MCLSLEKQLLYSLNSRKYTFFEWESSKQKLGLGNKERSVLVWSAAVRSTTTKGSLWRKGLVSSCRSHFITEGSRSRCSWKEAGGRNWSRDHEKIPGTGFFPLVCSANFLTQPRPAGLGRHFPQGAGSSGIDYQLRKCLPDRPAIWLRNCYIWDSSDDLGVSSRELTLIRRRILQTSRQTSVFLFLWFTR